MHLLLQTYPQYGHFWFKQVGTQGTLKGLLPEQLEDLDCEIMLGNTYHLGHRPVNIYTTLAARLPEGRSQLYCNR